MIARAVRSQRVKLARPGVLLTVLGASIGFAILSTVITLTTATATSGDRDAPGFSGTSLANLAKADGIVAGVAASAQFLGVVALALGAWAAASEYQHGTLRNLLVRQPRRLTLLAGSAVAVGALVVLAAVAATLVAALTATLVAPSTDVDTAAWSAAQLPGGVARLAVDMLGYCALGGVLGIALRSPVAAIGAGVAYALPLESILSSISSSADDVLPGRLLSAVADGSATASTAAVLLLWGAVAATLAAWSFARRDVAT